MGVPSRRPESATIQRGSRRPLRAAQGRSPDRTRDSVRIRSPGSRINTLKSIAMGYGNDSRQNGPLSSRFLHMARNERSCYEVPSEHSSVVDLDIGRGDNSPTPLPNLPEMSHFRESGHSRPRAKSRRYGNSRIGQDKPLPPAREEQVGLDRPKWSFVIPGAERRFYPHPRVESRLGTNRDNPRSPCHSRPHARRAGHYRNSCSGSGRVATRPRARPAHKTAMGIHTAVKLHPAPAHDPLTPAGRGGVASRRSAVCFPERPPRRRNRA